MKTCLSKRWFKYILIISGSLVCFCLLAVIFILLFCDNEDYRRLAVWSVQRATGYRMIVDGPFVVDLSAEPALTADRIRFEAVSGEPSLPLKSIGHFRIKIALKSLLLGTLVVKQLQVADVVITDMNFQQTREKELLRPANPPDISIPVFENVELKNIVLTDSDRKLTVRLNHLTMDDVQNAGPLYVKGDGSVNDTQYQLEGRLGALKELFNHQQPYPLALNLKAAGLTLSVSGTVADFENGEGLNLQLAVDDQNTAELMKMFQVDFPLPGHLNFQAMLAGDLTEPHVSHLKLTISGDPSVEILAEGAINNLRDGEGTDISMAVLCRDEALLRKIFPDDFKVVDEFKFNGALRKVPTGFRIEDLTARIVNDKGVDLEAGGRLDLNKLWERLAVKAVDLNLHLTAPSTASIRPLLTDSIPEIGSVDGRGRLIGPVDHLALEDLSIIRGGSGPVRIETHGRIGWISLTHGEQVKDMDLTVSIQAEQSKILSTFYGAPFPEGARYERT